jgi:hypothetical protein
LFTWCLNFIVAETFFNSFVEQRCFVAATFFCILLAAAGWSTRPSGTWVRCVGVFLSISFFGVVLV